MRRVRLYLRRGQASSRPEEKRTDVNIAVQMLDDGYQDACDRFIVVSGKLSQLPAQVPDGAGGVIAKPAGW